MASPQTLPEPVPEPVKFSMTSVSRLVGSDDEDDEWARTLRPAVPDIPPSAVPRLVPVSQRTPHSRESSAEKLLQLQLQQQLQQQNLSPGAASSGGSSSPQLHSSGSRSALGGVIERVVDPKAAAYGHHRQTSIVHGIQHSRNGSLASSTSSPLSPQMIAAAGAALVAERPDIQQLQPQLLPPSAFPRLEADPTPSAAPVSSSNNTHTKSRSPAAMSGTTAGPAVIPSQPPGTPAVPGSSSGASGPVVPERTSSALDTASTAAHTPTQRKLERMHSGKYRHEHAHHHSHSRHHKDDQKTVGEYALHVLFTSFIAIAEEKLNECISSPFDRPEPSVEQICGPGVDATFDQHLSALGHIAKKKPKPLIDSMMLWRKSKSDAANEARSQLQQARAQFVPTPLQRRNTEPHNIPNGAAQHGPVDPTSIAVKQDYVIQAERRSTVSIYVLCRVLLEVITQSSLSSITPEMEDKLEAIIFGQLKMADADQLVASPLRMANWNLFAQLLGAMSEISFKSVTDRFISDLERSTQDMNVRNPVLTSRADAEEKMELVLGGMKHLRLKISPQESWDQSCDFMIALGRLFSRCHGQKVKTAFCQIFDLLLLPVAATASNSDLSRSRWGEVLATVSQRLSQMFAKPRHWSSAFPLTATMLCASPPENFSTQWLQLVYPLQTRLKDRYSKPLCLQVLSRLVWTYLYRTTDSMASTIRKLEEVLKLILPNTKRSILAADAAVVEPLIQIIRYIGFRYPEYCFKAIIFPLINAELFTNHRDLRVENLEPDKIVIGIRAFLAVISDLEKGEQGRPPFPQSYASPTVSPDRTPASPTLGSPTNLSSSGIASGASTLGFGRLTAGAHLTTVDSSIDEDQMSRPVTRSALSESVREYYARFCEILGKITIICDNAFGGQAALDEKFSSPGPKTPMTETFTFARRDEHSNPADHKHAFYELLHVAVQALPRCLSSDIPFNSLINLLCTGTAHIQSNIAESSAHSLKAIARHSHAQQVTMGFSRFIFNFDDRYSTMSDGGMLGADHIENTLRLYVELLQIWIEEIQRKTKDVTCAENDSSAAAAAEKRGMKLDLSSIWAEVDQVEAHGLFFLCSQSRRVRHFAVTVLRLITAFDAALGKPQTEKDNLRVIDILEQESAQIMRFNDEFLTVAERSRLRSRNGSQAAIIEICKSDVSYDTSLWFKAFPNLIRVINDKCLFAVMIGRDLVCNRILQMYKAITIISEPSRGPYYGADPGSARFLAQTPTTQPELLIEQWRLYLVFACTTLADPGSPPTAVSVAQQQQQHGRKGSNKSSAADRIVSARTLFKYLNPLLSVSSTSVRDAVVAGMGSINIHIYRTLLEELQGHVSRCNDEARARIHQRTNSSPRRNKKMDLLRTEITQVYRLTAHFLKEPEIYDDEWILGNLVTYSRDIKLFLMDIDVQMDIEFQRLRRHYCGLMEELYLGINRSKDPSRWMTFEARKSSFSLMEDWCGFSPNQAHTYQRDGNGRVSMIDTQPRVPDTAALTPAIEIEKRHLRTAALSAMAALCGGPIGVITESGASLQFDIRRMFAWIEAIFMSGNDRYRLIGRQALMNLIVHNQEHPLLLEHSIGRCYLTELPRVLESYFEVVTQVLLDHPGYPSPFWRLLGLCLFTLGHEQSEIRSKSALMLRALEERQLQLQLQQQQQGGAGFSNAAVVGRGAKIQDFDISVSDKTKAVYKLAQYKISERLSKQHTEVAFHIFSEYTFYFKDLQPTAQRNVIAVILPWIQSIELKVVDHPSGGPTAESYVLLANLLEITIKSSGALHNEVQALWQALATGPHPGNVRLILDFIMALCLERREQNFVEYAKQIVVFLASTSSTPGQKVVDFLLMQITPKAMVPNEKRETMPPPIDANQFPYCADLNEALPVGTKQAGFSLGQLSMILLVDLMVSPVNLSAENVPVLLQVVTVLWDHYTPLVQEQAREMLVHLIHELVISHIDDETTKPREAEAIESLVELVRRHDKSVVWGYEDSNGKEETRAAGTGGSVAAGSDKVPPSMEHLTAEVVKAFEVAFPGIKEQWGRLSLTWATSCPVRHLACRSFQIFRCILTSLDQYMLADMLARLSNTIADEDGEIRTFSMEILTTLKTLIAKLDPDKLLTFPQLFWTTCACLESINEREFLEAVEMLNEFLDKLDFQSASVRRLFLEGQPAKWDGDGAGGTGSFDGLQPLLYKGLRSSVCLDATLRTLDKLVWLPSDALVGDDTRLFMTIIANLPRCLHELEARETLSDDIKHTVRTLLRLSVEQGHSSVAVVLDNYLAGEYREDSADSNGGDAFAMQIFAALHDVHYLPRLDFSMIAMLMGLLTNSISWVRFKTMRILCVFIPQTDMRQPEIAGHGSDLLSPLLRLLPTEYCMEALQVLDNIMTMSGSSMDKHHIRMSMTRPTSRSIRKEYERTQSLFGIPEESGWAIPMPAKKTDATRANIHAVFYSCQSSGANTGAGDGEGGGVDGGDASLAKDHKPTPEVEFHAEEFPYPFFFSPGGAGMDRSDAMMSDDGVGMSVGRGGGSDDVSLAGDLVTKLDSLDDFFDDMGTSPPSDSRSSIATITESAFDGGSMGGVAMASGAQLYDEIVPLLHQASNPSTTLQNAFADRPPGSRDGFSNSSGNGSSNGINTMNPGAFNFSNPGPAVRPSLHARSVTSPSAPATYSSSTLVATPSNAQVASVAASSLYLRDFASDDEEDDTGGNIMFPDIDEERPHTASGAPNNGPGSIGGIGSSTSVATTHPNGTANSSSSNAIIHTTITSSSSSANTAIATPSSSTSNGGSFSFENMIRPLAQSTRSRMRRLTGGRSRDERNADVVATTSAAPPPLAPPAVFGSAGLAGGSGSISAGGPNSGGSSNGSIGGSSNGGSNVTVNVPIGGVAMGLSASTSGIPSSMSTTSGNGSTSTGAVSPAARSDKMVPVSPIPKLPSTFTTVKGPPNSDML